MKSDNKRNTGKEKEKRNKGFPYKNLVDRETHIYINKRGKYKIVDDNDNVIEECRLLSTARIRLRELKRDLIRSDLAIEHN